MNPISSSTAVTESTTDTRVMNPMSSSQQLQASGSPSDGNDESSFKSSIQVNTGNSQDENVGRNGILALQENCSGSAVSKFQKMTEACANGDDFFVENVPVTSRIAP